MGARAEMPVVTGMGCVSSVGESVPGFWRALLRGESGIKEIEEFPRKALRNSLAGVVRASPELLGRAARDRIKARIQLFAVAALDEALEDARLDLRAMRSRQGKAALVVGTSLGMSLVMPALVPDETLAALDGENDANASLASLARFFDDRYGMPGAVLMVSTACASATHAIALACDMIRHDGYDTVIAGGADSLDRMKYLGHSALSTLTTRLPKPFSHAQDGTLFGEGAGFLVLERPGRSGAPKPHAICLGAGYSNDNYHVTAPDPEGTGAAMAMSAAVADANLRPADIGHVNLHGSGTALNDNAEYLALRNVFGDMVATLPCTSIKAAVGHAMGAAGALEAIATVMTLREQIVPPTLNVSRNEVAFKMDLVVEKPRPLDGVNYAISNSFGFGGTNGVVVMGR
ncbi:MAG TPA: beta-ketoacyl-[acyl-carrier-protein] synthase family protein [Acidithiobacillus sp.]|nr:beta-ketoacyl-[acyl-carrier-protein] synthase family protein [Acidithiobacillus sp.]